MTHAVAAVAHQVLVDKLLPFETIATLRWGGVKNRVKIVHYLIPVKFRWGVGLTSEWIYQVLPRWQHLIRYITFGSSSSGINCSKFKETVAQLQNPRPFDCRRAAHEVVTSDGWSLYYTVFRKTVLAKLFLPEICQISTNFDIFCRKKAKRIKLCHVHSFSTSPNLRHHTTVLNAEVPNCYTTQ